MPAFSFEKISPPVRRAAAVPAASSAKPRRRGLIVQIIDRFAEGRGKRNVLREKPAIDRGERET